MSKRTTNSSRSNCAHPLCVESLENRQLLSGMPSISHALPTTRMLPTVHVALSRVMEHQEMEPVMILHQASGVMEIMFGESLAGVDHSSGTTTDLPAPTKKAAPEQMALTHQTPATLSHGTALTTNRVMSSEKNGDSMQEIGSAARVIRLPSFQDLHRVRSRHFKGVSAAQPRVSAGPADTRRTQKGRAIALAGFWFEIANVLQASAKAEAAPTTEACPSGPEQKEADAAPEGQLALRMPHAGDAADIASQVGAEQADASRQDSQIPPPALSASILAGWLPIDLPALERKVDAFFSQIEKLGEEATDVLISSRLTPWLVIGTIAVGASYTLARRHLKVPALDGVRTGSDPRSREWTWLSNGAVLPPREKA